MLCVALRLTAITTPLMSDRPAIASDGAEIARQLALEVREVALDHADIEAREDRFLGLAVEQEAEGGLDTGLRRALAPGQPRAHRPRHGHLVPALAASLSDQDLEGQ